MALLKDALRRQKAVPLDLALDHCLLVVHGPGQVDLVPGILGHHARNVAKAERQLFDLGSLGAKYLVQFCHDYLPLVLTAAGDDRAAITAPILPYGLILVKSDCLI
jgi:hypothetical protein